MGIKSLAESAHHPTSTSASNYITGFLDSENVGTEITFLSALVSRL